MLRLRVRVGAGDRVRVRDGVRVRVRVSLRRAAGQLVRRLVRVGVRVKGQDRGWG